MSSGRKQVRPKEIVIRGWARKVSFLNTYYYAKPKTNEFQWDKPREWLEFEEMYGPVPEILSTLKPTTQQQNQPSIQQETSNPVVQTNDDEVSLKIKQLELNTMSEIQLPNSSFSGPSTDDSKKRKPDTVASALKRRRATIQATNTDDLNPDTEHVQTENPSNNVFESTN